MWVNSEQNDLKNTHTHLTHSQRQQVIYIWESSVHEIKNHSFQCKKKANVERERVRKQDGKMGVHCKDNIRVIIGRE